MSSTRAKNFRRVHHEEDDSSASPPPSPSAASITSTTFFSTNKPPKKLSFADDNDEDEENQRSPLPVPPLTNPSSHKIIFTKPSNLTPQPPILPDLEIIDKNDDQFEEIDELGFDNSDVNSQIDVEEDDDEDERIWEEEQFRKGFGKRIKPIPPLPPRIVPAVTISRSVEVMSIIEQSDLAYKEMVKNFTRLQDTHEITSSNLNRVEQNLTESLSVVDKIEKSLADTSEKFVFMQEFREFVSVLCEFLHHKAPLVEEIEEQMEKIHVERAEEMRKRRNFGGGIEFMEVDGEESDCETEEYRDQQGLLLETAEKAFSDAFNEYSKLCFVKEKFEKWKENYPNSYRDAYASLSVVEIFSPYVRLELLKWDPLFEAIEFTDMNWHRLLELYGLPKNSLDFEGGDADADLIPGLVEKLAVPILQHRLCCCWDVFSIRQTKNAVCATKLVLLYVKGSSEALQRLLSVIQTCIADAIASVGDFPFCMSLHLLTNIICWKDLLPIPALEKLALDELLNQKFLPRLQGCSVDEAIILIEKVMLSLNGTWTSPGAVGAGSSKLEPLADYVVMLGNMLENKHGSVGSESESSGPILVRRLEKILDELNQHKRAPRERGKPRPPKELVG